MIFEVRNRSGIKKASICMSLDGMKKDPNLVYKLRIQGEYIKADQCKIKITDLGFGQIRQASYQTWQQVIQLERGDYHTSDEKIQFQQKLRTTYLYSAAKKQKLLADMYLKHQLYVRALIAYQKLETVSGKLNAAEQIQVLYHMGLCQSRMFCFEEAKESFAMALRIKEDKQIQEAYFTAAYLAGDEEAFLEAGRRISFDEDQCKMIYQNIKEREKEVFQKEEFDKLGKIDYHRKKADENITRRLIKTTLGKWKDEYKAQTI